MNGVLNFSVLDGWWYEGYRFAENAGWALTDKRTYTDQAQQDKLDAATIYSMLENEIVPLYFQEELQGIQSGVDTVHQALDRPHCPHFTMKRQLDDYISRFYEPEARRCHALAAHNFKEAREIVEWKENFASRWNGIQVLGSEFTEQRPGSGTHRRQIRCVLHCQHQWPRRFARRGTCDVQGQGWREHILRPQRTSSSPVTKATSTITS